MSAVPISPLSWPTTQLLTLADWDALPEDEWHRKAELVEGVLQLVPQPVSRHQAASVQLCSQLNAALMPAGFFAVPDVEVLLREDPPLVRVPDLSVVSLADIRAQPRRFDGSQLQLAVEIVSPGSRRVDRIMKFADYADAGIDRYWIIDIIDLDKHVTLDAFQLAGGRYEPTVQSATGRLTLHAMVPIPLDLDALVP